jgi:hypothetical protein
VHCIAYSFLVEQVQVIDLVKDPAEFSGFSEEEIAKAYEFHAASWAFCFGGLDEVIIFVHARGAVGATDATIGCEQVSAFVPAPIGGQVPAQGFHGYSQSRSGLSSGRACEADEDDGGAGVIGGESEDIVRAEADLSYSLGRHKVTSYCLAAGQIANDVSA